MSQDSAGVFVVWTTLGAGWIVCGRMEHGRSWIPADAYRYLSTPSEKKILGFLHKLEREWQEERPTPVPLVQSQYDEMTAHCVVNRGEEICNDDQAVAARWRAAERRVRLETQKAALHAVG